MDLKDKHFFTSIVFFCVSMGNEITDGTMKYVYSYQAFDMQMTVLRELEIHWPVDILLEESKPFLPKGEER